MKSKRILLVIIISITIICCSTVVNAASLKLGDIDGDNAITSKDSKYLFLHLLGLKKLNSDQKKAADVNKDGKVTLSDLFNMSNLEKKEENSTNIKKLIDYGKVNVNTVKSMPSSMQELKDTSETAWLVKFIRDPGRAKINMNSNQKIKSSGATILYYANRILGADISDSIITSTYQDKDQNKGYITYWATGNFKGTDYNSFQEQLNAIYSELIKGNPVGVPVHDENGKFLYVLVYAVTKTTGTNDKLDASNFRVLDPRDGNVRRLGQYNQFLENGKVVFRVAYLNKDAVCNVKLNNTSLTLNKGATSQLKATLYNTGNIEEKIPKLLGITWSSNNSNVATVDANGKITAKSSGTAKITAKSSNGKIATCTVNVTDDYVYTYGGNTYKIAVTRTRLNDTLNRISGQNMKQSSGGNCFRYAAVHTKMLNGTIKVSDATRSMCQIAPTGEQSGVNSSDKTKFLGSLKTALDNKKAYVVYVTSSTGQHWVTVVGYKGNGTSFSDFLILGSYSGKLLTGGSGETCNGLRKSTSGSYVARRF